MRSTTMAQAEATLITPRRNFLIRALAFTAAGATLSVPIVTVADAKSRIEHHAAGMKQALQDYYGAGVDVELKANWHSPSMVLKGEAGCYIFIADIPWEQRQKAIVREVEKAMRGSA
jgi:hypothetical protein